MVGNSKLVTFFILHEYLSSQVWFVSVMNKMVDLLMLLNTMGGKESGRGTTSIVKMVKAVFAEASSMESAGSKMAKYYRVAIQ